MRKTAPAPLVSDPPASSSAVALVHDLRDVVSEFNRLSMLASEQGLHVCAEVFAQNYAGRPTRVLLVAQLEQKPDARQRD